jgi:dipeptidyl aminopeptidase/acylaminoacyl peptidase
MKTTSIGGDMVGGPHWSPDGKQIAFDRQEQGRYDIFVMGDDGRSARRLTNDDAEDANPTWSPDGRWIYFDSNRTGEFEVWRIPAEGGEPERVTQAGGSNSTVSLDGRQLYYVRHSELGGLWRQPIEGGTAQKVTEALALPHTYALTKRGVFYMLPRQADSKMPIRYQSFDGAVDREIALVDQFISSGFSATPDGDSVIYLQWDQHDGDLMLVENFQ